MGIRSGFIRGRAAPVPLAAGAAEGEDACGCSARGQLLRLLCREAQLSSAVTEHMEILAAKYQSLCCSSANCNLCQCITWLDFEGFHPKRRVMT